MMPPDHYAHGPTAVMDTADIPMDMFSACRNMYRIAHVGAHFADATSSAEARAINTLLELTEDRLEHEVIALDRVPPKIADLPGLALRNSSIISNWTEHDGLSTVRYQAPASGMLHRAVRPRLADALYDRLAAGQQPDLLVGYALTVDCMVVADVARRLGIGYALMIGKNDHARILSARHGLLQYYAGIFRDAAIVFAPSRRALADMERLLGERQRPSLTLPRPPVPEHPQPPRRNGRGLLTLLPTSDDQDSTLATLAASLALARTSCGDLQIDLVRNGRAPRHRAVEAFAMAEAFGDDEMAARCNAAVGFIALGAGADDRMALVDALLSGCPIAYRPGSGIESYLEGLAFAVEVAPTDVQSVAGAIERLVREEAGLKQALQKWQESPSPRWLRRKVMADVYADALQSAIG